MILCALVVPPFLFLLQGSFTIAGPTQAESQWGLGNFRAVLRGRHFVATSVNSLVFAAASAAVALVIGWVTAWIVERTNAPLKGLAYLTAIISLGTPYILYVTAWLLFFGKAGPVNHLYRTLTGSTDVLINIYSMPGMVLVEGFLWSPLAFLLVGATLRNANPELEEAARVHGAGVWDTIRRVTMRLSLPVDHGAVDAGLHPRHRGVRGAGAGRPAGPHLGAHDRHLQQHGGARAARRRRRERAVGADAAARAGAALRLRPAVAPRRADSPPSPARASGRGRSISAACARCAGAVLVLNFVLLLLVPMLMLVWVSLLPFFQPVSAAAFKLISLNNYRTVLASDHLELMINTLLVAVRPRPSRVR